MVSLALATVTMTDASSAPDVVAAPAVSLSEVPGTPLRYSLDGYDMDFATNSVFSSPAVADVTGDGSPEIVIGGLNSKIRVYETSTKRTITLDPGGADLATGHGATQASPVIADVNGDGVDDVVVANTAGRLAAFSVKGGAVAQIFNRYVAPEFQGALVGLFGTPAVGYVDGDRTPDIVTSSWGQTIDVFRGNDGTRFDHLHQWVRDTVWSSPAIGDVTGDGTDSIVVGGDCDGSGTPQPCYGIGKGGYVWAFRMDGSVRWKYFVRDAVVWSTPALTDLNGDGALDVVVGTGLYFLGPAANKIMALDGKTGQPLWNAATGGPVMGSPAVASVDGQVRIWVVSGGGNLMSFDASGRLLWQQCITDGACSAGAGTYGGVAIADVDDDGRLEAIVQGEQKIRVFDAVDGTPRAVVRSSYGSTLFASMATPTVAEVGGSTWIVQLNVGDQNGNLQTDGGDEMVVSVWTTGTSLGAAPWPTFKGNLARTGGPMPEPPHTVAPGGRICLSVSGRPGDAAIVNLTPVGAAGPGHGLLISSDIAQPPGASNVNYNVGTVDPNVAIAPIGNDGKVCFTNSTDNWVHLIADHLGTIAGNAYTPANPDGTPLRTVDTRIGQGGGTLPPSGRLCFSVAGRPGDAAIVNLTPTRAIGAGHGLLISSDIAQPPGASNVNYNVGTVDPNVAIAPIGNDGKVCFTNAPFAAGRPHRRPPRHHRRQRLHPRQTRRHPTAHRRHPHRTRRRHPPTLGTPLLQRRRPTRRRRHRQPHTHPSPTARPRTPDLVRHRPTPRRLQRQLQRRHRRPQRRHRPHRQRRQGLLHQRTLRRRRPHRRPPRHHRRQRLHPRQTRRHPTPQGRHQALSRLSDDHVASVRSDDARRWA